MRKHYQFILLVLFIIPQFSSAQQTGQFDKTILFSSPGKPNQTRVISFNVPANYSSAKKYKLFVGLHGQGSTSQNFCAAPFTSGFLGDVIMVCPSQGTSMSGFCDNTGEDEGILDAAVAEAVKSYNIDMNYIIITGFSFGGRCGLRYGLDEYQKYRGMMLFAPAVNSIAHAQNNPYEWNYPNAKYIPLCMVTGANDTYAPINQEVANQYGLAGAGNMVDYTIIPNFGHNVPPAQSYYVNCMNFIDSNPGSATSVNQLDENEKQGNMIAYPNPTKNVAKVVYEIHVPTSLQSKLHVTDVMGRIIEQVELNNNSGIVQLNNVKHAGVYFVRLFVNDMEIAEPIKLIKL